jgi:hypothetical protein
VKQKFVVLREFIRSIPFFEGGFVSTDYASIALLFPDRQLCMKKGLETKMNIGFSNRSFGN